MLQSNLFLEAELLKAVDAQMPTPPQLLSLDKVSFLFGAVRILQMARLFPLVQQQINFQLDGLLGCPVRCPPHRLLSLLSCASSLYSIVAL
jgi:hypothetical protein